MIDSAPLSLPRQVLRRALSHGGVGAALFAPDRRLLWSSAAEGEAAGGRPFAAYLAAIEQAPPRELLGERDRAFAQGRAYSAFVRIPIAADRRILHVRGVPVADAGQVESVFEVVQDVSEQVGRHRERDVQAVVDRTVDHVAHEINNPLAAIVGAVEMLRLEGPSEAGKREIDVIQAQVRRIAAVVEKLRAVLAPRLLADGETLLPPGAVPPLIADSH